MSLVLHTLFIFFGLKVTSDKEESKCLHVVIHHTNTGCAYSAKFLFDDHIRCMAAKQKYESVRHDSGEIHTSIHSFFLTFVD